MSDAAGRSRLQAGTLVIFLTRASQEQTRFVKLAASLRTGVNRKQRTKINLILDLFRALLIQKVKKSRNRPGVAQRVPRGLGYQIFKTFGT